MSDDRVKISLTEPSNPTWKHEWIARPNPLGKNGPPQLIRAEDEKGMLLNLCTTLPGSPLNSDGKEVLATVQLYDTDILYGMYHVVCL